MTVRIVALALALLAPLAAQARPLYFQNLTDIYDITPAESIHACGVCHQRWEGTGARNPFGQAVEAQLYLGKSIVDAILDIDADDTDGDGFTNGDELDTFRTLPGYSCATYQLASNTPPEFQSLITPGVPTCLEPLDIVVEPAVLSFITPVGESTSVTVELRNNGSDLPVQVTSVGLVAGAPASYSIVAPATPLSIPVGGSVAVEVTFAPTASGNQLATLRIASDDPDEPTIDVAISGLSFVTPLAPPEVRGACLKDLQKELQRVTKARLRGWGTCYLDELRGVACDTARRDRAVAKAEAKLRAVIGGERDTRCATKSLSATLLGLPVQCGAPCGAIFANTIPRLADCAVCRAAAATDAMLVAATGATPPDYPSNLLGDQAWRCNRQLVTTADKAIRSVQKSLGTCELDAILTGAPADCQTSLAATLAEEAAKVNSRLEGCADTTGMLGCAFAPGADPTCLGTASTAIGIGLAETVFGPN